MAQSHEGWQRVSAFANIGGCEPRVPGEKMLYEEVENPAMCVGIDVIPRFPVRSVVHCQVTNRLAEFFMAIHSDW